MAYKNARPALSRAVLCRDDSRKYWGHSRFTGLLNQVGKFSWSSAEEALEKKKHERTRRDKKKERKRKKEIPTVLAHALLRKAQ